MTSDTPNLHVSKNRYIGKDRQGHADGPLWKRRTANDKTEINHLKARFSLQRLALRTTNIRKILRHTERTSCGIFRAHRKAHY